MNFLENTFSGQFPAMLIRFIILLFVTCFIVDRLYYKKSQRRDYYFSFVLMSVAIFFLVFFMIFVLEDLKAKTSIGIGIGLFGIFSIMRYRTDAMPVREMTYMFVIIALSVVNAIANEKRLKQVPTKLIQYDRIELIQPEHRQELKDDLQKRLGLDIVRIDVGSVDFLRDMVMLKVYYQGDRSDETLNNTLKLKNNDLTNFSNN